MRKPAGRLHRSIELYDHLARAAQCCTEASKLVQSRMSCLTLKHFGIQSRETLTGRSVYARKLLLLLA